MTLNLRVVGSIATLGELDCLRNGHRKMNSVIERIQICPNGRMLNPWEDYSAVEKCQLGRCLKDVV